MCRDVLLALCPIRGRFVRVLNIQPAQHELPVKFSFFDNACAVAGSAADVSLCSTFILSLATSLAQ